MMTSGTTLKLGIEDSLVVALIQDSVRVFSCHQKPLWILHASAKSKFLLNIIGLITVVSFGSQSYKDELSAIKKDLEQVRKLGFQIMERVPDEKKTGVERRVEEVVHEHRELEKKVRTKEEVSACAVMTTLYLLITVLAICHFFFTCSKNTSRTDWFYNL